MSKVYVGVRSPDGAQVFVEVTEDGRKRTRPLKHIKRHSPTGFEWGYEGSGPADLANAILSDLLEVKDTSGRLYQKFKREVVGRFDRDEFRLTDDEVNAWLKKHWGEVGEDRIKEDLRAE